MQKHELWLKKAKSDLMLAKKGSDDSDTLDSAIYHTQQCAEKVLKAYLSFKCQPIRRIHDLVMLLECCIQFDKTFELLLKEAEYLNPFSIEFRYPDDFENMPNKKIVLMAIEYAEKVFKFTEKKIRNLETGQQNIFERKE